MAQRPLGIDVSHWQGTGIDWVSVKNSGVTFAFCKASESTDFTDGAFAINAANAKAAGVLIGAYHFARYDVNLGTAGATAEAEYFWSVTKNYIKGGGFYLMPILDVEHAPGATYTKTTLSQWVNTWCSNVVYLAVASNITIKPLIYTSSSFAGTWLDSTVAAQWTPWIANWNGQNPQTSNLLPGDVDPWSTWTFWQYSNAVPTPGAGTVDGDVFNGTAAGLTPYIIGTNTSPPSITSQPSHRYADRGGTIKFRSSAAGALPLKYQWRFNGTNIASATTNSYTLANLQANHSGSYTLVVTNLYGAVTSSVATLTVNPPFTPMFADNFEVNSAANWTLNQSSADTRIAFAYNYAGYGIPSAPNSTGGTTKGVKFEANVSLTNVAALNISPIGQSFSGNYRLHYDLWLNANGPFPAGGTGSTQHHTSGLGTAGNRVQWNSGTADGVWFAADGEGQATDTSATLPDWRAYVGIALQQTNSGVYVGGNQPNVRGNGHPYYQNVFPGGQTTPVAQAQSGGLDVGTIGFAWRDVVVNKTGSTVEWFIDGLKIATIPNVVLTSSNIFIGYWDSFASLSDNTNLSFGLVDNVRVEVPAVAPTISIQPQDVFVKVTSNATFSVTASGLPVPAYQWRLNGTNLAGANSSSFALTNSQYEDAGNYSVVVSNLAGSITSSNALLTLLPAAPAEFQSFALLPDHSLELLLAGDPSATYFVETSTNLVNWTALTNFTLTADTFLFNAGGVTNEVQRYFRARSGP